MGEDKNPKTKGWNIPNWRNANEYEYVNKLSADAIRWEFLRRMPEYRAAWADRQNYFGFEFGLKAMLDPALGAKSKLIDIENIYPNLAGRLFNPEDYREIHEGYRPSPELIELAKKSGHYKFYSDSEVDDAIIESVMPSFAEVVGEAVLGLIHHGYSLSLFNKKLSLQPQWDRVRTCLNSNDQPSQLEQKNKRKKTTSNKVRKDFDVVDGLRVLDAYNEYVALHQTDSDINKTKIALVIFPEYKEKYETEGYAIHKHFVKSLLTAQGYAYRGIYLTSSSDQRLNRD